VLRPLNASNQLDIPHPPLQQAVMTSHHPHPTTPAATMANHNERATSPIPNWLLPTNGRKQTNRLGPAVTATSTSTQSHLRITTICKPSGAPACPSTNPQPSDTTHQIFSPSLALASDNSVGVCRKAQSARCSTRDENSEIVIHVTSLLA